MTSIAATGQLDPFLFREYVGDENCLFLNIYTRATSTSSADEKKKLPVVVWIHGGGFQYGSGCDKVL